MTHYDAIMIGGGVMACSTAYHLLKSDAGIRVAIIEKDPSYRQSSSLLSDGNIRIQFNVKENIQMSQYGMEMIAHFAEEMAVGDSQIDLSFRQQGNLFLTDEAGVDYARAGMELQQSLGCTVEWLTADAVQERYEYIDKATIAGGTFGAKDGMLDPQALLNGYKNKAIDLGAEYIVGEVVDVLAEVNRVTAVRLADGTIHHSPYVMNGAGARGAEIARKLAIDIPVLPTKRQVFHLETMIEPRHTVPVIVFPSGLYISHEGDRHFLVGMSLPENPVGFDLTFNRQPFIDYIWENLVHYIPEMEQVKVLGGWAGLYAVNTFDGNAILGELSAMQGFLFANGFSGHGLQQCHAVGRYLSEVILGKDFSLDLSIFSPERLFNSAPVFENPHKLV